MKKLLGFIALSIVTASISVGVSRTAKADGHCRHVNGRFIVDVTTEGCTSPVGLCTKGHIAGAGPLNGTTTMAADGLAPSAGMPGVVAGSTLSYRSTYYLTTPKGVATLHDTGIFDVAHGLTASISTLDGGTGKFAGATGHIYLNGFGTTHLEADISGEVCFAGSPDDSD